MCILLHWVWWGLWVWSGRGLCEALRGSQTGVRLWVGSRVGSRVFVALGGSGRLSWASGRVCVYARACACACGWVCGSLCGSLWVGLAVGVVWVWLWLSGCLWSFWWVWCGCIWAGCTGTAGQGLKSTSRSRKDFSSLIVHYKSGNKERPNRESE